MSTVINLASVASNRVTMKDVASKAGVGYSTAAACLNGNKAGCSAATVAKVQKAAEELGYTKETAMLNRKYGSSFCKRNSPANSVFATRAAETAAMTQLRRTGHSDVEVAHRCGVSKNTVLRRIGHQSAEITAANKKLAAQVRSAKAKIKKAYQQKQTILEYNALADKLNAQLLEVQKLQSELLSKQKAAQTASKATKTKLVQIVFPNAKVS